MVLKISIEGAIKFTRLSVSLACCWPPPDNSSKWEKDKFNVLWSLSLLSAIGLLLPLLYSCYENQTDSLVLTKSACFLGAVSGFIIKIIICRIHRERIRGLIREMEEYTRAANIEERAVLERYIDRCSLLHGAITIVNYLTTSLGICGPFLLPDYQRFPTSAAYPFSIDNGPTMYLVYAHQSFVGYQCSVGATIDCQAALLVWYVGARFEILISELDDVTDAASLCDFVRKHQRLLRLADDANRTMSYIALTTTTMSGIGTVFSCLQFVGNQPISVKIPFGPVAIISIACLFVCAWPADNLIRVCDLVGSAVYGTAWFAMSTRTRKNVLMIMRRSQRPVVASVGGFLPALSLRYYASFLSAAFSYFTTLRMTVDDDS